MLRVSLKEYVKGGFAKLSNFSVDQIDAPKAGQLKANQILVHPLYISVDPHQRGYMDGNGYKLGEPITNYLVARIEASSSDQLQEGDIVIDGSGQWQSAYITDAQNVTKAPVQEGINPRDHLGILGVSSFTAYYGFVIKGHPRKGETILVSSASGGVGQVVVQLAKLHGLHVIGVAGSDDKVEYVKKLGADAAFNYKTCGDFNEAISKAAPQGLDMYYDNVGGPFLDAAILNLNNNGRVIACGITSQKNVQCHDDIYGIKNMFQLISKEASIVGINSLSNS
ncbi:hypothetical protein IWW36_002597 [Coemansia brasiliensis]|uniref:Enoyl reductase (ER) domain-containing protein n=1 Tax=Coemansia brasiliensis TaxID=2650707 RepID=A0A9W8I701_9FUNG|nr:hypothetical protein IWW36_002597 [Coemansia brasiliensis]